MRWLELSVTADAEAVEAVSEILGRVSAGTAVHPTALVRDPADEMAARPDPRGPYVVVAHVAEEAGAADAVEQTERALWHLQAFGLGPVGELRVRRVDDDWTDAWKAHYGGQRIGRVLIVPSWADAEITPGDVAVTLDPGMAFGTGLHPTTRACLELLQAAVPIPEVVLDVGCGSGILALAALRLGASRAVGLDTDALAVETATANAARNALADRFEARHGTLPEAPERRYRLVLANLVASVLHDLAPRLAAHVAPDGCLIAGGIMRDRAGEVLRAMADVGLAAVTRRDDGDWVSLRLEGVR